MINEDLCIGCGACAKVCSQGAIIMQQREIIQVPTSERVWVLKNKITTLEERLDGIKDIINEINRRG
jgi:ferredoxin